VQVYLGPRWMLQRRHDDGLCSYLDLFEVKELCEDGIFVLVYHTLLVSLAGHIAISLLVFCHYYWQLVTGHLLSVLSVIGTLPSTIDSQT